MINSTLIKQADVVEKDSVEKDSVEYKYSIVYKNGNTYKYNLDLVNIPQNIEHMSAYLTELFNLMIECQQSDDKDLYITQKYEFNEGRYIKGIIYKWYLSRRSLSYFYVLQQSDIGIRFLLYAMDTVDRSPSRVAKVETADLNKHVISMKKTLREYSLEQIEDKMGIQIEVLKKFINNDKLYLI